MNKIHGISYNINKISAGRYMRDYKGNETIFKLLGIDNKYQVQKLALGYSSYRGNFPLCRTRKDLFKFIKYLGNYKKEFKFIS